MLVLLVPEELSLSCVAGRLGYCQNGRYNKPTLTHSRFTKHIEHLDGI